MCQKQSLACLTISPVLANFTLNGAEQYLYDNMGLGAFARFADDILILYKTKEQCQKAIILLDNFLKERGLETNKTKTKITFVDNNEFQFVGYNFFKCYKGNRKTKRAFIGIPLKAIKSLKDRL